MASVVLMRGVNVGGRRSFRPTEIAGALDDLGVRSIGAAGTFVVAAPVGARAVRDRFAAALPFETEILVRPAREVRAVATHGLPTLSGEAKRFVTLLARAPHREPPLPHAHPSEREWQVRIEACIGRWIVSAWRRRGPTTAYPNEIVERACGVAATTRTWATLARIAAALDEA